jgi:electron transfer flavoprotein alpha subunit
MRILVYVEIHQNAAAGSARELVSAARELAGSEGRVLAIVAHAQPDAIGEQITGVDELLVIEDASLGEYNPEAQRICLETAIAASTPDIVLLAYTSAGLDLGPAVAARRSLPLVSYCTRIERTDSGLVAHCQIYSGKLSAKIELPSPGIAMITPGAYREHSGPTAPVITEIPTPAALANPSTRVVSLQAPAADAIDITQSERLICVGRGIRDKDSIDDARELATLMGGEIAGSRPVIDAGWLPKERQVGKSGRTVKPRLYLALGVSGAPEHLEGMSGAEVIVAINSDARAPIFAHAHYGATIDLFDFVAAMTSRLGG